MNKMITPVYTLKEAVFVLEVVKYEKREIITKAHVRALWP